MSTNKQTDLVLERNYLEQIPPWPRIPEHRLWHGHLEVIQGTLFKELIAFPLVVSRDVIAFMAPMGRFPLRCVVVGFLLL